MKLLIILMIFIFISCNSKKEDVPPKIKILNQKEASKILKNDKKEKPKLKEKKVKEKVIIKMPKGKKLEINQTTFKKIEKNLENKKVKEKEKIKTTLDDLEFLEYKKNVIKELNKGKNFGKGSSNKAKLHISDKMRAIFKPVIDKYSMRHLSFKNNGEKVLLNTISLSYENKKKRIELEVTDLNIKFILLLKKGQKDFFYKSYKLGNISIHLSINYKLKVVNGVFNHLGYTWIISGKNINDMTDILDIIRNINFNTFMELRAKYEEE